MSRDDPTPTDAGGTYWARGEHEIAARIERGDLAGRLRRGLEVQPGTRVLLFEGGRYVGALAPGRHEIEGVRRNLGLRGDGDATAIAVDDGEISVDLHVGGLRSLDRCRVAFAAQAAFRITDPELFVANLLRGRRRYEISDLELFVAGEMRDTVGQVAARHPSTDLDAGELRAELEQELLSRWKPTFDRSGLTLQRLRVLRFSVPWLDAADEAAEAARLESLRLDHELAGRRKVFDQEASEEERRLGHEQLRRRGLGDVQIDKIRGMEAVRQEGKDREADRRHRLLAEDGETFSKMTPEQILAMAAARKPENAAEVAAALQAVRGGDATERERELYERLLSEVRSNYERSLRLDHDKFIAGFGAGAGGPAWRRCAVHQIRYAADDGCPLCGRAPEPAA